MTTGGDNMGWIRDEDIKPMWGTNYPRRNDDAYAHAVCVIIVGILKEKAIAAMVLKEFDEKLNRLLQEFEVPKAEFERFEEEELYKET
jgi:hypothetical protein